MTKKILLVEGKEEELFFEQLKKLFAFDYEVKVCEGKDDIKNKIQSFLTRTGDDFPGILGIIRDADHNASAAFESVASAVERQKGIDAKPPSEINSWNLESNPQIGIFIMPGTGSGGALEDLLLNTIDSRILECIESYISCVEGFGCKSFNKSKAKLKAFLCVGDDYEISTAGSAIKKGDYFDLESPVLNQLKSFLQEFAK